jgi:putative membrane protein (TIGR04086 family)
MEGKMVNVKENNSNGIVIILKGSLISIIATIVLLMIFATVLTYSNINENSMPTVIIVVTALCILVGSQITTSKIKRNGIVNGALVGAIYILALYLISSIISKDFSLNIYSIIMMATSILIGGIGGIIGVNKK